MYPLLLWFNLIVVLPLIPNWISQRELVKIYKNGIVLQCSGLFTGQLILKLEKDLSSIVVLMLAYNPDLAFAVYTTKNLIQANFEQCMTLSFFSSPSKFLSKSLSDGGYTLERFCPLCIEKSIVNTEKLLTLMPSAEVRQI